MRMVYKIVLGMLLFNAFMTFYSPLFNACVSTPLADNTMPMEDIEKYNPQNDILGMMKNIFIGTMGAWGLLPGVAISLVGLGAALVAKNYVFIGVSLFVSIVITLYINMSAFIASVGLQADMGNTSGNLLVTGIIAIVGIAIGLLVMFSVVDMFAPAGARE